MSFKKLSEALRVAIQFKVKPVILKSSTLVPDEPADPSKETAEPKKPRSKP